MYFRCKETKSTPVLQLIESHRDPEGNPRQKIILSIGNPEMPKELWKAVANEVENRLKGALTLLKPSQETSKWADRIISELEKKGSISPQKTQQNEVRINPKNISHHNSTELGPELVALKAWNSLGFPKMLEELGFNSTQIRDAAISIMNRLLNPCSENALPQWAKTTSLEDLFGKPFRDLNPDRFYRIADKLLENKEAIEKTLSQKEETLFSLDRSIYLYDLTNTYFEGSAKQNHKAKRGRSKEKRSDAPLVSVGLVLDRNGFTLRHQTFAGNIGEAKTLLQMVKSLDKEPGKKPIVIVDSGIASDDNLKELKKEGFDYIVPDRKARNRAQKHV